MHVVHVLCIKIINIIITIIKIDIFFRWRRQSGKSEGYNIKRIFFISLPSLQYHGFWKYACIIREKVKELAIWTFWNSHVHVMKMLKRVIFFSLLFVKDQILQVMRRWWVIITLLCLLAQKITVCGLQPNKYVSACKFFYYFAAY